MKLRKFRSTLAVGALALTLLAAGCGGDGGDGNTPDGLSGGSIGQNYDLSGATLKVGSKEFTEQLILGNLTTLALKAAGADASLTDLQGSTTVRAALESDEIDLYWEYLGTGWVTYLGNETGIPGVDAQYQAVRDADAANGITWLDPTPFNNTYAIAISNENAQRLAVSSLSDLAALANSNPDEATFCAGGEFATRPDGLPGMGDAYGFTIAPDKISNVQDALVYTQVDKGDCNFGSIFATDGRVAALGLTVLADDKAFFPQYNCSLNVRTAALDEHAAIKDIFAPIAAALDDATMTALNAKVDVDSEDPADVAEDWLRAEGYIG